MKTLKNIISILFVFSLLLNIGCLKDGEDTIVLENKIVVEEPEDVVVRPNNGESFSPTDVNMLSQGITPVGTNSTSQSGTIPSSTGTNSPVIGTHLTTQIASNGSTVQLPITVTNGNQISGYYIQIAGSNTYYKVPVTAFDIANGTISFTLPSNLTAGNFTINYCVYDANNQVSQTVSSIITVEQLGSGVLQFTLSWNQTADLDLHIFDPKNEEIYYSHRKSNTDGTLDRDDVDGFGPENVFWNSDAPNGDYLVKIKYYAGNQIVNYSININTKTGTKVFNGTINNLGDFIYVVKVIKNGDKYTFKPQI